MPPYSATSALMIRPACFSYNTQTAETNAFQNMPFGFSSEELLEIARREFDGLASALTEAGVRVVLAHADPGADTPDALFPNNWISFHTDGRVFLYPMATPIRRREVRPELIDLVESTLGVQWRERVDLTPLVGDGAYLEGTGSLVFDRVTGTAFACRSQRTTDAGIAAFRDASGVNVVVFDAADAAGVPYYHTNVMMAVGEGFAAVCLEAVDGAGRGRLRAALEGVGKEIVELTRGQCASFAGNMLQLISVTGDPLIILSEQARASLSSDQTRTLERFGALVSADLQTIEFVAGGSARCMIAAIHPPEPPHGASSAEFASGKKKTRPLQPGQ